MFALRGATTVTEDTKEMVLHETKILLNEIINKNSLNQEDIISIIFTATKDLKSVYPAVAARELGLVDIGLMCMQEMYVEGSLGKCIRVLMYINKNDKPHHVYLNGSKKLRPDLCKEEGGGQ
ncbi:MAG: chorismate mutase [Clostridiales bacterium]|jgi:chorismate mutase|nr:chorismate mutase [Clostridiales bacterium]